MFDSIKKILSQKLSSAKLSLFIVAAVIYLLVGPLVLFFVVKFDDEATLFSISSVITALALLVTIFGLHICELKSYADIYLGFGMTRKKFTTAYLISSGIMAFVVAGIFLLSQRAELFVIRKIYPNVPVDPDMKVLGSSRFVLLFFLVIMILLAFGQMLSAGDMRINKKYRSLYHCLDWFFYFFLLCNKSLMRRIESTAAGKYLDKAGDFFIHGKAFDVFSVSLAISIVLYYFTRLLIRKYEVHK